MGNRGTGKGQRRRAGVEFAIRPWPRQSYPAVRAEETVRGLTGPGYGPVKPKSESYANSYRGLRPPLTNRLRPWAFTFSQFLPSVNHHLPGRVGHAQRIPYEWYLLGLRTVTT